MCIQSYYNYNQEQNELELDLLSEIKELGIDEWNKKVDEERVKIEAKENHTINQRPKEKIKKST